MQETDKEIEKTKVRRAEIETNNESATWKEAGKESDRESEG